MKTFFRVEGRLKKLTGRAWNVYKQECLDVQIAKMENEKQKANNKKWGNVEDFEYRIVKVTVTEEVVK